MQSEPHDDVEILYAEDNAADAEMTIRAFKRHGLANKLVWVEDGEQALDYLFRRGAYASRAPHARQPKLVLLDLKMPKVDGVEVLRVIRATADIRSLPVVMLTSSAEESDIVATYDLGISSYIVKPIEFDRFVSEVSKVGYYWLAVNKVPSQL